MKTSIAFAPLTMLAILGTATAKPIMGEVVSKPSPAESNPLSKRFDLTISVCNKDNGKGTCNSIHGSSQCISTPGTNSIIIQASAGVGAQVKICNDAGCGINGGQCNWVEANPSGTPTPASGTESVWFP